MALDKEVFSFLNSFSELAVLQPVLRFLVNEYFVPVSLALTLFYLWLLGEKKEKNLALVATLAVGGSNLLIKIINLNYFRARPFLEIPTHLLYYKPTDSSFPSNASAVAFALATAIWLTNKRLGSLSLLLALTYSLARVIVGVHYPSDVLAGALIGAVFTLVIARVEAVNLLTKTLLKVLQFLRLEPLH
ncbi:MAG: phosphatase PAP2 family protein [bacterium]|nr:phosphatase PAP2 family protein [bacterium]